MSNYACVSINLKLSIIGTILNVRINSRVELQCYVLHGWSYCVRFIIMSDFYWSLLTLDDRRGLL